MLFVFSASLVSSFLFFSLFPFVFLPLVYEPYGSMDRVLTVSPCGPTVDIYSMDLSFQIMIIYLLSPTNDDSAEVFHQLGFLARRRYLSRVRLPLLHCCIAAFPRPFLLRG
jgi:hypothetical protein